MSAIINANNPNKKNSDSSQTVWIDVYVGVFFDGTNNNMMQSMIGQKFRRDKIFNEHKKEFKKLGVNNVNDMMAQSRSSLKQSGILTENELDKIFGKDTKFDNSLEKQILAKNSRYSYSSVQVDNAEHPLLPLINRQHQKKVEEMADPYKERGVFDKSFLTDLEMKGAFSAGATYTNPCILWSMYQVGEEEDPQDNTHKIYRHKIYVEGSGADSTITLMTNITGAIDDIVGLGFGVGPTGVSAKCRKMATQINNIYSMYRKPGVREIRFHFDVFGFSRGSTTARMFTYMLDTKGGGKVCAEDYELFTGKPSIFLPLKKQSASSLITMKEVRMLGIYDTVSSIGILRDALNIIVTDAVKIKDNQEFTKYGKSKFHDCNVKEFGLYATDEAKDVLHICALDEHRVNFSLVDIESSIHSNGTEIFLPGCHTDIGGGASLGQDDLKVINTTVSNTGEILGSLLDRVEDAKGIAYSVSNVMGSAKELVSGVRSIVYGAQQLYQGDDILSGAQSFLGGLSDSYKSARQMVSDAHSSVGYMKDVLLDVNSTATSRASQSAGFTEKNTNGQPQGEWKGTPAKAEELPEPSNVTPANHSLMDSAKDMLDKTAQTIDPFLNKLKDIKSYISGISQTANSIKSALGGTIGKEDKFLKELGRESDTLIRECGSILTDINLSSETLTMLREMKDILTETDKSQNKQSQKAKIDDVNDVLSNTASSLKGCDSTVKGMQTMMEGLSDLHEHQEEIKGIHDMVAGMKATLQSAKKTLSQTAETANGVMNNLSNIYQNTLYGFHAPSTAEDGVGMTDNLKNTAAGMKGMDKSFGNVEKNVKSALDKMESIRLDDFHSIDGINKSLSAVSESIESSTKALENMRTMMSSTQQMTSNTIGFGKNLYSSVREMADDLQGKVLDPAKSNLLEYMQAATGNSSSVLENISSKLSSTASGLTGTVNEYGKMGQSAQQAFNRFKDIENCNLHSFKGVMSAFSQTSDAISSSINSMQHFHSMLESAKQTSTNALGLGSNVINMVSNTPGNIQAGLGKLKNMKSTLGDYFTPNTGNTGSIIGNMSSNVKGTMSGIAGLKSGYQSALSNAMNAFSKVQGLRHANLNSVHGIANALNDSATAINSTLNAIHAIPGILGSIKQTTTNILGMGKNLQHAFTKENGQFAIVNECSEWIGDRCEEMKETWQQMKETAEGVRDLITGKKKPLLPSLESNNLYFYNYYPCTQVTGGLNDGGKEQLMPVSIEALKALGWAEGNAQVETNQKWFTGRAKDEALKNGKTVVIEGTKTAGIKRNKNIGIYKYCASGYSNVSLQLMLDWCEQKAAGTFNIAGEARYSIPDDLSTFYYQVKNRCLQSKGRHFCVPKYSDTYRKIRLKYLHFSFNQQLLSPADNTLVNGPSIAPSQGKLFFSRRIYTGTQDNKTTGHGDSAGQNKYIHEYIGSEGTLHEINFNL